MSNQTIEISGQCQECKDFFTVELFPVRRAARPGTKYYRVFLTNRLAYKNRQLIHRPGVCGGTVKLIGNLNIARYPNGRSQSSLTSTAKSA
jgi:hypothetical protein